VTIYVNRAWDAQAGPGFVTWRTGGPDLGGLFYPGPGTFGVDTSDVTIADIIETSVPLPAQIHPDTAPVGSVISHWHLDGDFLDAVGGIDLTASGTVPFGAAITGTDAKAAQFNNNAQLNSPQSATSDPLRLTGAMTFEALVFLFEDTVNAAGNIVNFGNQGINNADNSLYGFRTLAGTNELFYFHESNGPTARVDNSGVYLQVGRWHHVAFTRDAAGTLVRQFVDGLMIRRATLASPPETGTSSHIQIGDDEFDARGFPGIISSVRVINAELRPEHILADARLTLPPELRP
jgi:hypothetical protein